MRKELELALDLARSLTREQLPRFIGDLEEIRVTAYSRLSGAVVEREDSLLDVAAASKRLGVSRDYLYRNHRDYPFVRRIGRTLKFSSLGIDKFLRS